MQILSKLSDECKKCSHVNECDNKRMVACALAGLPQETLQNGAINNSINTRTLDSVPIKKEYTPITINMGGYGAINTSIEEISNEIRRAFQINCAFNKS